MHGKTSQVLHDGKGLFRGLQNPLTATRYHSLLIERSSLPEGLEVCAETDEGEIMALRVKDLPIAGVQFHPESILTPEGKSLLRNAATMSKTSAMLFFAVAASAELMGCAFARVLVVAVSLASAGVLCVGVAARAC